MRVKLPEKRFEGKYFENLKREVIDRGLCSHCGTCAAVCPVYGIELNPSAPVDFPGWEEKCIDCGMCVRVCPRWEYKALSGLGEYVEVFSARSKRFRGQDGGMVTELLAGAFEMGLIDMAVVVKRDENWMPIAVTVRDVDSLSECSGTKYGFAQSMVELRRAVLRCKVGVGFVGTPCMVSGVRRLQRIRVFERVRVVVGLFCMENFYYDRLVRTLSERGVDLRNVKRMGIRKGKFFVEDGGVKEFKVKELSNAVAPGCHHCKDFTSVESDISVGSVGSGEGFSTVVVRTDVGKRLADFVRENCEIGDVKLEIVKKLCDLKAGKS